jgi:hypothetical protein
MDGPAVAVVAHDEAPTLATPKPPPTPRGAPKWETEARERVKAAIKRFSRPLADLVARDANEGDTRLLVTDFLCEGLGYDKYAHLTPSTRSRATSPTTACGSTRTSWRSSR